MARYVRVALITLSLGGLIVLPLYVESTYVLHMMILIFINVIVGSSWNILGGYTGQYSVGHAAYFGVGAYTTMILMQFKHVAPWWGVWAGTAGCSHAATCGWTSRRCMRASSRCCRPSGCPPR